MDSEMDVYAQESHDESEKEKEDKSPPHPKQCQKEVRVVKSKEYKIRHPKKERSSGNVPYVQKSSVLKKNSMITLQQITIISVCSDRKCGKAFGSLESLKKHQLCHGNMKFLCSICGAKFPFASDLSSHQALHSQEKKFVCPYPKCSRKYKTKAELNCHYNYRHKQNCPRQPLINVVYVTKHFKEPNI